MRLVEQVVLELRDGRSDKVYEVDLCEVGADQFVVNFRYGRRGSNLRDGSKTVLPVSESEARSVYTRLVASKVSKGYRDVTGAAVQIPDVPDPRQAPPSRANDGTHARDVQRVLDRLDQGPNGRARWPLSRAVWLAGERRMEAAASRLVLILSNTSDTMTRYCAVWALGRLGTSEGRAAVEDVYRRKNTPPAMRHMAGEALLRMSNASQQERLRAEVLERLDTALAEAVRAEDAPSAWEALGAVLVGVGAERYEVLSALYLLDQRAARASVLRFAREASLKEASFVALRRLFKAAEFREDAELFGILAHRFETTPGVLSPGRGRSRRRSRSSRGRGGRRRQGIGGRTQTLGMVRAWAAQDNAQVYSEKTRAYLRRRVWRTLRRMGQRGEVDYVNMAVGVLVPFTDADAKPIREVTKGRHVLETETVSRGRGRRRRQQQRQRWVWRSETTYWGPMGSYYALGHIMYGGGSRYVLKRHELSWACAQGFNPNSERERLRSREERFARLWDQRPAGLIHVMMESRCGPVQAFAANALWELRGFWGQLDRRVLLRLLRLPYGLSVEVAYHIAKTHYDTSNPDIPLVLAVLDCMHRPGREEAQRWVSAQAERFVREPRLIAGALLSQWPDTRSYVRRWLSRVPASREVVDEVVERVATGLTGLGEGDHARAEATCQALLEVFPNAVERLGQARVLNLLQHPLEALQRLGLRALRGSLARGIAPSYEALAVLMESPFEAVQVEGLELLELLPDDVLLAQRGLIVAMFVHDREALRASVRPLVVRLAMERPGVGQALVEQIVLRLAQGKLGQGVAARVIEALRKDHARRLARLDKAVAMALIRGASTVAKTFGGALVSENVAPGALSVSELVELGRCEARKVRELCWSLCPRVLGKLKANVLDALELVETDWDDTRVFAIDFFDRNFGADVWTLEAAIVLCDSVRPDVQRFGRAMLQRHWHDEHGLQALQQLAEHPDPELQLFTTNYLERYAAGDADRVERLLPYFRRVLSRVNAGSVAKARVWAFVEAEALRSEASAAVLAPLLERQSATVAIQDRARAIEIMVRVRRAWPSVTLPILPIPTEAR